eukprot:CAMPEP_0197016818 /NCGR_PEP_ID=MMETSP1380-20130617/79182_1 /TAXON_ID=5936 /ORGANISM="Euplotes crassus, Strain CT5" /LENGTH=109 /DNA_ID=CAMNT_0042443821 /DNA_START=774 /DNA_END=1103 /DNA_ORIENTATION=+
MNHTEKNLLKVLSQDLLKDLEDIPQKELEEDTNSVDDSDDDYDDGSQIILKERPLSEEETKKPEESFITNLSFSNDKRLNLQSKGDYKKFPFLSTLSKKHYSANLQYLR